MKTAIVYYSLTGNCKYAARMAARRLSADLIEIAPVNAYPEKGFMKFFRGGKSAVMGETPALKQYYFEPEIYDRVIFCFPVWAGNVTPPIRTFIEENLDALKGKRLAAILCHSGGGGSKTAEKLKELLDVKELELELELVDPRNKPDALKDKAIEDFCIELNR